MKAITAAPAAAPRKLSKTLLIPAVSVRKCHRVCLKNRYVCLLLLFSLLIFAYVTITIPWSGTDSNSDESSSESGTSLSLNVLGRQAIDETENAVEFFRKHVRSHLDTNEKNEIETRRYIKFYNKLGKPWTNLLTFEQALMDSDDAFKTFVRSRSIRTRKILQNQSNHSRNSGVTENEERKLVQINIATAACGKSTIDVMVLLKSAVIFSRDAYLHIILFGDTKLPLLAEALLGLKWTANTLGWDFTYELHPVTFPPDRNGEWKKMYALCASQRLFVSNLLPHIDSLLYLDADSIVVSNLTNFWNEFQKMNESQIVAIAPNTEFPANGFYNVWSKVPYYGERGLNGGVIAMNLTRMRNFYFETKAKATYTLYKDKIQLADQDILNIIFHAFPEKLYPLDCTYNFFWAHCGEPNTGTYERICFMEKTEGHSCFCQPALQHGIQVVHGNTGTFHDPDYPLFQNLFKIISKFNLSQDSYEELIQKLMEDFDSIDRPCFSLSAEKMYENARIYFRNLKLIK